ncbi:MAG: cysteine hydrolase family protein [Deferrisomatales bacterium]|nr:cysteine hydrolase family protein [Deferrisomatales bacterium]MDT8342574.1 cysteine hydrolase family protein [Longimicrobiales bacterium]
MSRGLLLVDIQNDYFPGGAMELVGMDRAAARAAEALKAFRAESLPVFHVQHLAAQPGAAFFLPGTPGAEIRPLVAPRDGETVVRKHFPNSFRGTPLLDRLRDRGVTELTLCGAMSHMCIDATTRAAFDLGFSCTVRADACATRDLAFGGVTVPAAQVHAAFMAALAAVYAKVSGADG